MFPGCVMVRLAGHGTVCTSGDHGNCRQSGVAFQCPWLHQTKKKKKERKKKEVKKKGGGWMEKRARGSLRYLNHWMWGSLAEVVTQ